MKKKEKQQAILYKGTILAPNSDCFKLHKREMFKELDQHLKMLDKNLRALTDGRFEDYELLQVNIKDEKQ